MNLPEAQRAAQDGKPWPDRCANFGHAVGEALRDAGRAGKGKKDLAYWVEILAKRLKEERDAASADLTEPVDGTWTAAKETRLSIVPSPEIILPPAAVVALNADSLAAIEPLAKDVFPLAAAHTDLHPGLVLRLLVEDKSVRNSKMLCT